MTDRSAFTDDEWRSLAEAPLQITLALAAVGPHGPISMAKEAAASARELARPSEQGPADELIAAIARDASGHEARHDVKAHSGKSPDQIVDAAFVGLKGAAAALAKVTPEEATELRAWFGDIAKAVAGAAKSISSDEQAVIDRITAVFQPPTG